MEAGMKDTGAGTLQAGAVWNLPSPSTSNVRRISAMAESFNAKTDSSEPISEGLQTRGSSCSVLLTPTYMHIPAKFR